MLIKKKCRLFGSYIKLGQLGIKRTAHLIAKKIYNEENLNSYSNFQRLLYPLLKGTVSTK